MEDLEKMNMKRIIISLLLVCIVALSISGVYSADSSDMQGADITSQISTDANSADIIADENDGDALNSENSADSLTTENNANALGSEISVTGSGTAAIQNAISSASAGDTVNLGENKEYNIGNDSISISKKITLKGNNVTIHAGSSNGGLYLEGYDISIQGISFVNTVAAPAYGGTMTGRGIYAKNTYNLVIDDCKFIDYEYGIDMYNSDGATIKNCWFNGTTTSVSGMAGTGTKALQLMGSTNANVINNTFFGQIYDGLSIASGSGYINIENNKFINNTFAIFHGGASTKGNVIKNNTFITCGNLNTTWKLNENQKKIYGVDELPIIFEDRPYIALQKASNDIDIIGNEFIVKNHSRIIYAEPGNTDHGYPTSIGAINIKDNKVTKEDGELVYESVIFMHINVQLTMSINPTEDIVLENNNFTEVPEIEKLRLDFNVITEDEETGDITIPKIKSPCILSIASVKDGQAVIKLADGEYSEITGEKIDYKINNGNRQTATTDEEGQIYISGLSGTVALQIVHPDSESYARSNLTTTIQLPGTQANTVIQASKLSVAAASAKNTAYKITLRDGAGEIMAGKSISISFNGKIYSATTGSNGVASFKIPVSTAGNYAVTLCYTGDATHKGCVATSTISIVKQASTLKIAKKTFKKSAVKKVTATLKVGGKTVKGKKITFNVNGKTYTAKTNAKGVATAKVKLSKKGTFKYTAKFAGDSAYKAVTKTSEIIVK